MAGPAETRPKAVARALAFIQNPRGDRFDGVARDVFAHQYTHNPAYQRLCLRRGMNPALLSNWQDIPPVPTAAFRAATLTTAPAERVFRTSGTSGGAEIRGEHHLPALDLYAAAWIDPFRANLLPDRSSMRLLSLIPGEDALPDSSLSWMVARALDHFGSPGSGGFLGTEGLRFEALIDALTLAHLQEEPVLLLGTAFGLVHFLDALVEENKVFDLPPGSRVMDTGGFKGRSRSVSRDELLSLYEERLGIAPSHVVGEYGMTELCSQFYEPGLKRTVDGVAPGPRVYLGQPWTRTRVLDPDTLRPVPPGEEGLLAHYDLANAWTVSAVVTEDLGVQDTGGFRVLGRAEKSELRGCSIATEELLRG